MAAFFMSALPVDISFLIAKETGKDEPTARCPFEKNNIHIG